MLYQQFFSGSRKLAVLIDPDKHNAQTLQHLATESIKTGVDVFLVGGSVLVNNTVDDTIHIIKEHCTIPVVLFPGHYNQLSNQADALLLLSLVSGRNPEYLIGQHVESATTIKQSGMEVIPTAYLLIDGGRVSTTQYVTQTQPIPNDKPDVAAATALAGELLGMQLVYLEAGSGALHPVPPSLIQAVKKSISVPLVVGGGLRNSDAVKNALHAGADMVVVGNVLEQNPSLLQEFVHTVKAFNLQHSL